MPVETAVKLCECGCGQPAPIAKRTDRTWGQVKGQPLRFVHGHRLRGGVSDQERRKIAAGVRAHHARLRPSPALLGRYEAAVELVREIGNPDELLLLLDYVVCPSPPLRAAA